MLDNSPRFTALPAAPGVGYKPQHFSDIMDDAAPVEWLEIHAENYMGDGGRPIAQLRTCPKNSPFPSTVSVLASAAKAALDADHLARLKHLCDLAATRQLFRTSGLVHP